MTHTSTELDCEECTACNGTGSGQDGWDCLSCSGDGWVFVAHHQPAGDSTSTEHPEALRLADRMEWYCISHTIDGDMKDAAKELRRLHARAQELEAENAHLKDAAWTAIDALEASQAQRVPLSDEQIDEYVKHADMHGRYAEPFARGVRWGIRHYERAHGITQEKQG